MSKTMPRSTGSRTQNLIHASVNLLLSKHLVVLNRALHGVPRLNSSCSTEPCMECQGWARRVQQSLAWSAKAELVVFNRALHGVPRLRSLTPFHRQQQHCTEKKLFHTVDIKFHFRYRSKHRTGRLTWNFNLDIGLDTELDGRHQISIWI